MATYDPSVISSMADHMYARASRQVIRSTIVGAVLGVVLGYIAGVFAYRELHSNDYSLVIAGVLALLGGIEGFAVGRSAAHHLRFQAQQALVMAEIERNTRRDDAPDPEFENRRIELTR
jgi:NhaP-type Na+/H+ or K+/H+ antiporter